jgi:hypothetical protein
MRKVLALVTLFGALTLLVHVIWVDVWMSPQAAYLLDRRSIIHAHDEVACRARQLRGTVIAVGGQSFVLASKQSQALSPEQRAGLDRSAHAHVVDERECRPILRVIGLTSEP